MKSIVQKQSLEKGKYFIILGTNLEYNDETYYEQGHAILEKKFYKSIDEAKAHKLSYIGMAIWGLEQGRRYSSTYDAIPSCKRYRKIRYYILRKYYSGIY
jgi:hypothetical protein